jgi:hypothetical protein
MPEATGACQKVSDEAHGGARDYIRTTLPEPAAMMPTQTTPTTAMAIMKDASQANIPRPGLALKRTTTIAA